MVALEWTVSHAVFVPELDGEHAEIFESLFAFEAMITGGSPIASIRDQGRALIDCVEAHFAHEERLMRASRYGSYRWHKKTHDNARRRVGQLFSQLEAGGAPAAREMAAYLTRWLHDHTRVVDMLLASFLRNHRRGLCKMTFRAGTKPVEACQWVDAKGEPFRPGPDKRGK